MNHSDNKNLMIITPAKAREEVHLTHDVRVSSPFIVQMAASHAGIGPYQTYFREEPDFATACYRATDMMGRSRT